MLKVVARYAPKMSEERSQRIIDALMRCNVRLGIHEDVHAEFSVTDSDIEWGERENGTHTELTIYVDDNDMEHANRIASELRCCGMVANVEEFEGRRGVEADE
jgi:hypothetical protein